MYLMEKWYISFAILPTNKPIIANKSQHYRTILRINNTKQ